MLYYSGFKIKRLNKTFFIAGNSSGVCRIALSGSEKQFVRSLRVHFGDNIMKSSKELKPVVNQIKEYFGSKRRKFNVNIIFSGPEFLKRAWKALSRVDYGKTISYTELARRAGNSKASRAAGTACAKNPVPILIPCHRVIAMDGSLGGFGGGLRLKEAMLEMENTNR